MHPEALSAGCKGLLARLTRLAKKYDFVLAGGTALALQLGHRISYDLDFFTKRAFDAGSVLKDIDRSGVKYEVLQRGNGTLLLKTDKAKFSYFRLPYISFEEIVKYSGVKMAGIRDIAAMKLLAIYQRGTKRDFVDLFFILRDLPFRKACACFVKKYGATKINPVGVGKSLVYFADAESDVSPEYIGDYRPKWDDIKKFYVTNIKQLVYDLETATK